MKKKIVMMREKIDRQLVNMISILNKFPGIKTCFSCCGHGDSEFYIVMDFNNSKSVQKIVKAFTLDKDNDISYMMLLSDKEKTDIITNPKLRIYDYMYRIELMPLYEGYGKNMKIKVRLRIGNIGLGLITNSKRRKKEIDRVCARLLNYLHNYEIFRNV